MFTMNSIESRYNNSTLDSEELETRNYKLYKLNK